MDQRLQHIIQKQSHPFFCNLVKKKPENLQLKNDHFMTLSSHYFTKIFQKTEANGHFEALNGSESQLDQKLMDQVLWVRIWIVKNIDFHDWGKLIFITIFIVLSPNVHCVHESSSLGFLRYLYLFAYSKLSQYIFSTWVTKRARSKILTCCRSFPVFDVLHVCPSLTGCTKQNFF